MNSQPNTQSFWPIAFLFVACATLVGFVANLSVANDNNIRMCLEALRPLVDTLLPWGKYIETNSRHLLRWSQHLLEALGVALLVSAVVMRKRRQACVFLLLLATLTAIHGQIGLVLSHFSQGIIGYCLAVVLFVAYWIVGKNTYAEPRGESSSFSWRDTALLFTLLIVSVFLRFYALNRIFDYFEGEETPFSAAGNDLRAMALANVGDHGPWSPFGYLYFITRYATTQIYGTSLLVMRFAGVFVSLITALVAYFMLRNLFSRTAAIAGVLLLTIDAKQLSWSRFEFPHGSTSWTALAICWLTVYTFSSRNWIFPALLSIFMGLCFHQYPSGQTAFMIPFLYLGYCLIFNREQSCGFYLKRIPFLVLGVLLWYYGQSFAQYTAYGTWTAPHYFNHFDGRISWKNLNPNETALDSLLRLAQMYWKNFIDLFGSMTVENRISMPPQEVTPSFSDLPVRTIFILVPPFVLIAAGHFARNRDWRQMAVLLAWVVAAAVPSVLSNEGHPRRAATIFPALICVAAAGYALARESLYRIWQGRSRLLVPTYEWVFATVLVLAVTHQWFSGVFFKYGESGDSVVARKLKEQLEPGTLVFLDYTDHYTPGRFTFLMLDYLKQSEHLPVSWRVLTRDQENFDAIVADPVSSTKNLGKTLPYHWSHLWYQIPEIERFTGWTKLLYISERFTTDPLNSLFDERMMKMGTVCENHKNWVLGETRNFRHIIKVMKCDLKR